uniref:Uncharacterized protein n=1 Tax=Anguilla anguilla TaxID=7936 RepID=A0A0E9PT83_ANGAN
MIFFLSSALHLEHISFITFIFCIVSVILLFQSECPVISLLVCAVHTPHRMSVL